MKSFIPNHFKSLCAALIIGITGPVAMSERPAHARISTCPTGLSSTALLALGACGKTPDLYKITVYKFALCTADPFTPGGFDVSVCQLTFDSSSGTDATLYESGSPLTVTLSGSTAPPPGTYTHAAILIGTNFVSRNSYTTSDLGTIYSTTTGGSDLTSPAEDFTKTQDSFADGTVCEAEATLSLGTMKARVLDSSMNIIATPIGGSCPGAHRLAARMQMNIPITISTSTSGLIANFTVTDSGSTVYNNGGVIAFDNGPFQVSFTTIE